MIINEFTEVKPIEWIAADTETHTYIDGKLVTVSELIEIGKSHNLAWFREHATVHTYAWLVSDGIRFAWFETFDEFVSFCATFRVGACWWYNAKFDFSAIDYHLLTNGWESGVKGRKLKHKQYRSLHADTGQRYQLDISYEYRHENRHYYPHTTRHVDFCNIVGGGLEKILENFKVTDFDGNPIRKTSMDYQSNEITPERIAYMKNDTHGLYHAVRIADATLRDMTGYSIAKSKPDVITAGGIAKRVLLRTLYGERDSYNIKCFQRDHRTGRIAIETWWRKHSIYRGGMAILNPRFTGKWNTTPLYKYDINSMYPFQMSTMPDLVGLPRRVTYEEYKTMSDKSDYVAIVEINELSGRLRPNMLPVWWCPLTREYTPYIEFFSWYHDEKLCMFLDEYEEIKHWYDIIVEDIPTVILYKRVINPRYAVYVDTYYSGKAQAKRDHNKVMEILCKLLLNSSYGKLAENPRKIVTHREINPETGAVRLVSDDIEESESTILSVVQGALITSMARVHLMRLIRDITHNDPAHLFVYCDTDSIAAIVPYDNTDPYTLGALKDETGGVPFNGWKYLAPKTYMVARCDGDHVTHVECHTKGVPTKIVQQTMINEDGTYKTVEEINNIFKDGKKFRALAGINIRGGKALIPIEKELCKPENMTMFNNAGQQEILMNEGE